MKAFLINRLAIMQVKKDCVVIPVPEAICYVFNRQALKNQFVVGQSPRMGMTTTHDLNLQSVFSYMMNTYHLTLGEFLPHQLRKT